MLGSRSASLYTDELDEKNFGTRGSQNPGEEPLNWDELNMKNSPPSGVNTGNQTHMACNDRDILLG